MYSCLRVAEVVRRRLEEEVMMELEGGKEVNRDNGAREEDWKDEGDDDGGGSRRSGSQSNSSLSTSCFISFTGQ